MNFVVKIPNKETDNETDNENILIISQGNKFAIKQI